MRYLNESDVRQAKPAVRPYKLWDGKGLHLAVQPSGSKIWRFKCRSGGRERVISFGHYPQISLIEARIRRDDALEGLAQGRDIWTEARGNPPASLCFEAVARTWHSGRQNALSHFYSTRLLKRLEKDIFPTLGHLFITRITANQVLSTLRLVEQREALTLCLQLKRMVGKIFRFAIANGWAQHDPTISINDALKSRPRTKHHRRISWGDFPALVRRIAAYDDHGRLNATDIVRDALKFTLLTWSRTMETRFAAWSEFEGLDGPQPLWRIPTERMKMQREHLVPLSRQAAALVRDLRQRSQGKYLFAGRGGARPISQYTMIAACHRMGYRRRQTVHGFRSIASTWANERLCYNADCVEMALAHYVEDTRGAYNSALYLAPRRQMLQDWADTLSELGLVPFSHASAPLGASQPESIDRRSISVRISHTSQPLASWGLNFVSPTSPPK